MASWRGRPLCLCRETQRRQIRSGLAAEASARAGRVLAYEKVGRCGNGEVEMARLAHTKGLIALVVGLDVARQPVSTEPSMVLGSLMSTALICRADTE